MQKKIIHWALSFLINPLIDNAYEWMFSLGLIKMHDVYNML